MAVYTKISMADIWASNGEIIKPDSAKIATGWVIELPPRQWWNWFENRQDNNIAYLFQRGFAEWDAETEYLANNSYVLYNGLVYKCLVGHTNQLPTNPTYWDIAFITPNAATKAMAAVTPAADQLPYFTSGTTAATTTITAFARTLLDDATQANALTTLGAQPLNVKLTALGAVASSADKLPYFTSSTAMAVATLSAFARTLIDDADAGAMRTTLGLGTMATQSSGAVTITGGSVSGITDLAIADGGTGASTAADARTNLGLGTAATAAVTTSGNDLTPNSLTKVGDFGIGARFLTITEDYNNLPEVYPGTGVVGLLNTGALNAPASGYYYVHQYFYGTGATPNVTQLAIPYRTDTEGFYIRSRSTGVWTSWQTVYTSGSLSSASIAASQLTGTIDDARLPATISSSITGNAATATKLATARTINGVSFDGSANITIADSTKLPTTGGTISGILTSTTGGEAIQLRGGANDVTSQVYISFERANGTRDGYVGKAATTNANMYVFADTGDVLIYPATGSTILYDGGSQKLTTTPSGVTVSGTCAATTFSGNGSLITSLDADNIATGTLPVTRGGTGTTTSTGTGSTVRSVSPALTGTPTAPTAAIGTNTTQIATTAFARGKVSVAQNGYQELPSGIIIQWGRAASSIGVNGSANFTFPIAFAAVYSLSVTGKTASAVDGASANYTALSTTGFTVANGAGDGSVTEVSWIAIGV